MNALGISQGYGSEILGRLSCGIDIQGGHGRINVQGGVMLGKGSSERTEVCTGNVWIAWVVLLPRALATSWVPSTGIDHPKDHHAVSLSLLLSCLAPLSTIDGSHGHMVCQGLKIHVGSGGRGQTTVGCGEAEIGSHRRFPSKVDCWWLVWKSWTSDCSELPRRGSCIPSSSQLIIAQRAGSLGDLLGWGSSQVEVVLDVFGKV